MRRLNNRPAAFALAAAVLLLSRVPTAAQTAAAPPDLDAHVARAMRAFEVPAMAVGVVKDGAAVAANGYGVRRLGEPARADRHTLFGIASNTKVFTARGARHHAPVVRYLPWSRCGIRGDLGLSSSGRRRQPDPEEGRHGRQLRAASTRTSASISTTCC